MKRWTRKLAAARSRTKIDTIERALLAIAYEWGDVDNYIVNECDRLRDELTELRELVAEASEEVQA